MVTPCFPRTRGDAPTCGATHIAITGYEPWLVKWIAWHEGGSGFLFWSITYCQDPYPWDMLANEAEFGPLFARQGDGILFYPGDHHGDAVGARSLAGVTIDGPEVSYHMKQVRNGLENRNVFWKAPDLGVGDYARAQVGQAVTRFGDILDDAFDGTDRPWTLDEQVLLDAPRNVYRKVQHIPHPDRWPDPEEPPRSDTTLDAESKDDTGG